MFQKQDSIDWLHISNPHSPLIHAIDSIQRTHNFFIDDMRGNEGIFPCQSSTTSVLWSWPKYTVKGRSVICEATATRQNNSLCECRGREGVQWEAANVARGSHWGSCGLSFCSNMAPAQSRLRRPRSWQKKKAVFSSASVNRGNFDHSPTTRKAVSSYIFWIIM
jgi:hypothetical protein